MSARFRAAIACALIVCGYAAPTVAQTKDDRAKALLGLARVKKEAGDPDAARKHFEEAAALRPLVPQEREEYFWVLAGRDPKAATTTGRSVLADLPGRGPVRDRMITEFLAQGDESSIVALATEGERLEPGVALWPRRLGQSALRSGNANAAVEAFERAVRRTGSTSEDEDGLMRAVELREQSSPQVQLKRELNSARQNGSLRQAIAAAEALAASPTATPADRLTLIELQIQNGDPRAGKSLEAWIGRNGCSQQTMTLADRMRDPDGTDVLVRLLNTSGCPTGSKWIERGIERSVAVGKHSTARTLLARLPAASANQPAMRRLAGQLALWTGNPAEAIVTLENVLKQTPTDRAARTCLVDAYRAVGRSKDAWATAEPLTQQPDATERLLVYAELALEAGKPAAVPAIVARVPQSPTVNAARARLLARSHLAAGRPADAFKLLEALNSADLDVPAALALLDSAIAISGPAGALASARRITADKSEWRDVVARQYLIEALAGDPARAKAKRTTLAGWDPKAAAAVDAEVFRSTLSLAHARASAGDHQGALAALGPASGWDKLPIDARRVAADSLRALGRPREAIDVLLDTAVTPADSKLLAELHATIGRADLANGRRDAAQVSAERAVTFDPSRIDVWIMLAELVADDGPDALAGLTKRGAPSQAVVAFHLSRARTFAAAQEWDAALGSIDALLRVDANNSTALRFQADVLSWSGRHAESLVAYDAYLSRQPDDVEAARQQARVFGWIGQYSESKRRYARLVERNPSSRVVLAESDAKAAFFDGRWSSAIDAYGRWLELEPNNGEAAFERAEALRAAGRVAEADAALRALASSANHQMAAQAWDRVQMSRRATVAALTDAKSTNGYDGRRLLDVQGAGAGFDATARHGTITTGVQTSYVRLDGGDASRRGYRIGGGLAFDPSATVKLRGRATVWNLDTVGVLPEGMARVDWRPIDRWTIGVGGDRSLMLENLETVDRKLAATGMFAATRFESPVATLDANVGWHYLTDDNRRARATVTYDRRLSERLAGLRMLVWAEALSFENSAADYYSPSRQLRLDAGGQYTHEFRALKFRQDLRKRLSLGYLIGTDRDGVVYHHPTANLTLDFANGLALVARGDWIQSDVYKERSFSIGMTVTPGGRR